ncbi:unnamed protein product, partial [Meganyctiphanes norvegica]
GGIGGVGGEVSVMGGLMLKRPSVIVSGVLVLLGVVDCLVSLACATITAKEACGLYSAPPRPTPGLSEGHNRKERLYNWLGQQKTIFPIGHGGGVSSVSQFVPLSSSDSTSSATPRRSTRETLSSVSHLSTKLQHHVHPTQHASLPAPSQSTHHPRQVVQQPVKTPKHSRHPSVHGSQIQHSVKAPAPFHHSWYPPHSHQSVRSSGGSQSLLVPSTLLSYQRPYSHHSLPPMRPAQYQYTSFPQPMYPHHPAYPPSYYSHFSTPMMPNYPPEQVLKIHQKDKKRKKSSKKKKEGKKKHKKNVLTDEQIEKSYTGLDREIADSFIENAMEPGLSINRAFYSCFEQDSFSTS